MTWAHSNTKHGKYSHRVCAWWEAEPRTGTTHGQRARTDIHVDAACGARLWGTAILTDEPALPVCPTCAMPRTEPMVYFGEAENGLIKIGCSAQIATRVLAQRLTLLATEPGGFEREREIHRDFAEARVAGEYFTPTPALVNYIAGLVS
jgi:hypothetical protein